MANKRDTSTDLRNKHTDAMSKLSGLRSRIQQRAKELVEKQPDRPATDEEWQQAHDWADKTTIYLIQSLLRWEKDGRPALYPESKKDLENTEE